MRELSHVYKGEQVTVFDSFQGIKKLLVNSLSRAGESRSLQGIASIIFQPLLYISVFVYVGVITQGD